MKVEIGKRYEESKRMGLKPEANLKIPQPAIFIHKSKWYRLWSVLIKIFDRK